MGDNTDNQLGINQRGKSEDPVLRLNAPKRIHLSAHSRAAKPVQVSCGASHTAAVTGQLYVLPPGCSGNMHHLNSVFVISFKTNAWLLGGVCWRDFILTSDQLCWWLPLPNRRDSLQGPLLSFCYRNRRSIHLGQGKSGPLRSWWYKRQVSWTPWQSFHVNIQITVHWDFQILL